MTEKRGKREAKHKVLIALAVMIALASAALCHGTTFFEQNLDGSDQAFVTVGMAAGITEGPVQGENYNLSYTIDQPMVKQPDIYSMTLPFIYSPFTEEPYMDNCTSIESALAGGVCINSTKDHVAAVYATNINSNVTNSTEVFCTAQNITMDNSYCQNSTKSNSAISHSTNTNSNITDSTESNCQITDTTMAAGSVCTDSTKQGSMTTNSQDTEGSHVTNSNETNSLVQNSTIINSTIINSTAIDSVKINAIIINSNNDGSSITGSNEENSTVIDSTLANSDIEDTYIDPSTIINCTIKGSYISNSTKINSNINNSRNIRTTVINSKENGCSLNDSIIYGSNCVNSIVNRSYINCTVSVQMTNAVISNDQFVSGTLLLGGMPFAIGSSIDESPYCNAQPITVQIISPPTGTMTAVDNIDVTTNVTGADVAYLFVNGEIQYTINNAGMGLYNAHSLKEGQNSLQIQALNKYGKITYSDIVNVNYIVHPLIGQLVANQTLAKNGDTIKLSLQGLAENMTIIVNTSSLNNNTDQIILNATLADPKAYENILPVNSTQADGIKTIPANVTQGNVSYISMVNITLDNTPPNASISINGNAAVTNTPNVMLTLGFSDANGVKECRVSNRTFTNISGLWEPCMSQKAWLLDDLPPTTLGAEQRTVFFEVKDNVGLIRDANASILLNKTKEILDYTPPENLTVNISYNWTNKDLFTARWYAFDKESKVYYKFRIVRNGGNSPSDGDDQVYPVDPDTRWADADNFGQAEGATIDLTGQLNHANTEGSSYYFEVVAMNPYDIESQPGFSDAIRTDYTPPKDISFAGESASLNDRWQQATAANIAWNPGTDPSTIYTQASGIKGYSYMLTIGNETPDDVPDGDPNNLAGSTNITFAGLVDGTYHFRIRAIDNAGNAGPVTDYALRIDNTPPGPPQPGLLSVMTSSSQLDLGWVAAQDGAGSGIDYYTVQACKSNDFVTECIDNVNATENFTSLTGLTNETTYYIRIFATDKVGLESEPSTVLNGMIDQKPPIIRWIKPRGLVIEHQPTLALSTDEISHCNIIVNDQPMNMTFTDSIYHEKRGGYVQNGHVNVTAQCFDRVMNNATEPNEFDVNDNDTAAQVLIYSKSTYYIGEDIVLNVTVLDAAHYGLGELPKSRFALMIGNDTITDYGLGDNGNGEYSIVLPTPLKEGDYIFKVAVDGSSNEMPITVKELTLGITYNGFSAPKSTNNVLYETTDAYTIGIGTDASTTIVEADQKKMETGTQDGSAFIFVTSKDANIDQRSRYLRDKVFQQFVNPSFGYPIEKNTYTINTELSYDNIIIRGAPKQLPSGRYSLVLRNAGIDPKTGKTIVEVDVR